MCTACPTTSAKGEDRGPAVIMAKWSVSSTDLPYFISANNGDRKSLTASCVMKGHHCDCFALNYILWLKQLRTDKEPNDQKCRKQPPTQRNETAPGVCGKLHCA